MPTLKYPASIITAIQRLELNIWRKGSNTGYQKVLNRRLSPTNGFYLEEHMAEETLILMNQTLESTL